MKRAVLRPAARADRRAEVQYYRRDAGANVAAKLVRAMSNALQQLALNPAIGSPTMGQALGMPGMRTWRLDGFPLSYWYFEREDHLDVARLVGHGQDASLIAIGA